MRNVVRNICGPTNGLLGGFCKETRVCASCTKCSRHHNPDCKRWDVNRCGANGGGGGTCQETENLIEGRCRRHPRNEIERQARHLEAVDGFGSHVIIEKPGMRLRRFAAERSKAAGKAGVNAAKERAQGGCALVVAVVLAGATGLSATITYLVGHLPL